MSAARQINNPKMRQWRILLVYNIYRIVSIFLFLGIYYFSYINKYYPLLFLCIAFAYLVFALIFLYFWHRKILSFDKQVFLSGTIDVIAISSMLGIIGNLESGYGILLNVTIAALSILVPGRLAIYFASLASCLLLCGNVLQFFIYNQKDLSTFFYSGIYGAGFFATAITAWYLSNWVRISESLARHRSYELAGMQRLNEYIVERLHSGIIYVAEGKRIRLMNTAAREFFNLSKHHAIQKLDQLSDSLVSKFDDFLLKTTNNERTAQTIIEDPYLRVHFFSTSVGHKSEVLIILEDMTYIAQQAQQLKLAALGRFSASIAHELRNPLGAIAHAIQLFGDNENLNEENTRLKQLIMNNCERMNRVIKNVLQLSRREKSQPQVNELTTFLEHFKHDFTHNNPCDLTIKLPVNKPLSVVFDKSQLEQILVILCENAIQHGRDHEGNVNIVIAAKCSSNKITLTVCDSGPGIPSEHRDNIFEPFFTTLRGGTGMGLFIARDLCEINQARLNLVKSNKGCCFAITFNPSDELLI
ncbi:sensor histidine kinase [Legionella pneumophila serogroup 1]|uniref:sensor histidine kinase n=1 Tax=Legionella pneumophila TaxID=446 RepID=UPI000770A176|nr:ATP-binding protein [Legionella pneumophila]HAT8945959.1 sensor histidine kinase [Legionella pneumophila subsp. pneumophila]MCH9061135.1 sensor histidine kinase [Legionella pneumophila serogroup 1]MCH9062347.1 sensor histidine kinase [Legionella pneumophila serogroup 1]MCH9067037.1 sensor histidine kinase [Legionella pneumophila serogroup 1]MCH9068420.1 sensor histidine kinase [Legionella pneumophila serogroup 1]